MATLTEEQEQVRALMLKVFPNAQALDDDTLDEIAQGRKVTLTPSKFAGNMDFSKIVELLLHNLPAIAHVVSIVKGSVDIWSAITGRNTPPSAAEIVDEIER